MTAQLTLRFVVVVVVLQDFLVIVMLSVGIFVSCSSGAPANERLQKGPVITAMTKVI